MFYVLTLGTRNRPSVPLRVGIMKSFQDRLFKDFDVKKEVKKNGKIKNTYVYVGDYAVWNLTDGELVKNKGLFAGAAVLICAALIWGSLQRVPLNSSKLSGAAQLLCFAALIPIVMGVWQFVFAPKQMYLRDCRSIKDRIFWGSLLFTVFRMLGFLAGIVALVLEGFTFLSIAILISELITAGLALVLLLRSKKLRYLEIPGKR